MTAAMQTHGEIARPSGKTKGRLGPHSRAIDRGSVGWSIDGRSREGRFLRAYEAMLKEHLGGHPSTVQVQMIHRAARLALHLELQDEKALAGAEMTADGTRIYISWHRNLMSSLRQIGVAAAKVSTPTLREYLDSKARAP